MTTDKLAQLRALVRELRDRRAALRDAEERVSELKTSVNFMENKTLPDLFLGAKVSSITIDAEGNLPAYTAELRDYYHAVLPKGAEAEADAYAVLDAHNATDLFKFIIEITLPRNSDDKYKQLMRALKPLKWINGCISQRRGIPWNTLTAWIKARYERHEVLGDSELRILGATIGKVVKPMEVKADD
jgi:hypothetical protein